MNEKQGVAHGSVARATRWPIVWVGMMLAMSVSFMPRASAQGGGPDKILKAMSDYVTSQKTLSVTYDSDVEVITPALQKIQFASSGQVQLSRPDKLRAARTGSAASGHERFRNGLVIAQVALCLVLVVAAGLFIRTFTTLATLNVGFDRDPVLLVRLDVPQASAEPSQRAARYERIAATVRATPGVAHAAISEVTPVSGTITANIGTSGSLNQAKNRPKTASRVRVRRSFGAS